jgi:hypothetical protein
MKRLIKTSLLNSRDHNQWALPDAAKVNALPALCLSGWLQSANGEELRPFVGQTLMPRILDNAFKGEL